MLSYGKFRQEIIMKLKENYPGYSFSSEKVMKTNESYYGVRISLKGEKSGPIINLTGHYNRYLKKEITLQEIVWKIWDAYIEASYDLDEMIEKAEMLYCFDNVKDNIYCKVVNRDLNEELIQTMPHMLLLNLACIYYVDLGNRFTANITNAWLKYWGINQNDIHELAIQNMRSDWVPVCRRISDVVGIEDDEIDMWIMTMKKKDSPDMGASIILFKDIMNQLLEEKRLPKQCYIIPSSIDELVIIPSYGTTKELINVIKNAYKTILNQEKILSNVAYYFDREKNEIKILN